MTAPIILEFRITRDLWLTSNQRPTWPEKARITRGLRDLAGWTTRSKRLPTIERAHIVAYIQYPTRAKADPNNCHPTTKALVDGCVDAGLFPDDDHTHVVGPDHRRAPGTTGDGTHHITLKIYEQDQQ